MKGIISKAKKLFAMPLRNMLIRLCTEVRPSLDRATPGEWEHRFDEETLLNALESHDMETLHQRIMGNPSPWSSAALTGETLEQWAPGETERILKRAETSMEGRVCLMGSNPVILGEINWNRD